MFAFPHRMTLHDADYRLFSGDKPLNEALKLMDDEGISSLAVVDNGHNVIGNISTVDVKVRLLTYRIWYKNSLANVLLAPHEIEFCTSAHQYLHPLHFRYSFNSWNE